MKNSIIMATGNRGDHASKKSIINFVSGADIAGITEMESEAETRQWFHNSPDYGIYEGDADVPQDEQSIIVWKHDRIRVHNRVSLELLPEATRDGKHNMAKFLLYVRAEFVPTGDEFLYFVYHQIQTLGAGDRYDAAEEAVTKIDHRFNFTAYPVFGCGDWNAPWEHRVMQPFHDNHWHCDSTLKPQLDTMEHRDIDYFIWRNLSKDPNQHGLRVTKHWTENIVGSDHDGKMIKVLVS